MSAELPNSVGVHSEQRNVQAARACRLPTPTRVLEIRRLKLASQASSPGRPAPKPDADAQR